MHLAGGCGNVKFNMRRNFLSFDHFGGLLDIFQTTVNTAHQIGFLNFNILFGQLRNRMRYFNRIRTGNVRNHRTQIQNDFFGVIGIGIRQHGILFQFLQVFLIQPRMFAVTVRIGGHTGRAALFDIFDALFQPFDGALVHRKHTGQGAPFGRHVGNGQTLINGKFFHTLAAEFKRMIQNFVVLEIPRQGNNDIFARYART